MYMLNGIYFYAFTVITNVYQFKGPVTESAISVYVNSYQKSIHPPRTIHFYKKPAFFFPLLQLLKHINKKNYQ